jgi:glycine hydroxymethyltransferase
MNIIAAKAVCFKEALSPEFKVYQQQVMANARALAEVLKAHGFRLISGGTDNHLILVDLTGKGLTGAEAEKALEQAGITVNKNAIPFDPLPPKVTSGIRIGTPAVTTRGLREKEIEQVGEWIVAVLNDPQNESLLKDIRAKVTELCERFPLYTELKKQFPL